MRPGVAALALGVVAACGRVAFDDTGVACPAGGCEVTTTWAQRFGSPGVDFGFALAADVDAVYLTGLFTSNLVDFGTGPLTSQGFHDLMLVTFDAAGGAQRSLAFGGPGFDEAYGVASSGGQRALAARASDAITVFGAPLTHQGLDDILLIREGAPAQDAVLVGGVGDDRAKGVAVTDDGTAWIVGVLQAAVDFGGTVVAAADDDPQTVATSNDGFVASYAPDGTLRWARGWGDVGDDDGEGIVVDAARGQVIATGSFTGTIDLGLGPLTSAGARDGLVVAFDAATGQARWHVAIGGAGEDGCNGVALGAGGEVYVTAYVADRVDLAGQVLTSAGAHDVLIARVEADGTPAWASLHGGAGEDRGIRLAVGARGEVVVVGSLTGAATLGDWPVEAAGDEDGFVLALDDAGAPLWQRLLGGAGPDEAQAVVAGPGGGLYVTGAFSATADLGLGGLTSAGGYDTFVVRLDPAYP